MKLHTNLSVRQCVSTLEHHTDSARRFTLVPDKTYVMRLNKDRFCIWRVYGSEMPPKMDICSPAFYGRFVESDGHGTTIVGRFGLRFLAGLLMTVVMLPLAILMTMMIVSPPPMPLWSGTEGQRSIASAVCVGVWMIWPIGGWIRDRATMIDFLVRILDAKQV